MPASTGKPTGAPGRAAGSTRAGQTREHLLDVLAPVVAATGYDLEDVTVTSAGRRSLVRVIVDADGGVDLDAVAEVSRVVSEALDGDADGGAAFAGPYVLEVSSPGVDRPLTEPRHWRRAIGRLVQVGGGRPHGDRPRRAHRRHRRHPRGRRARSARSPGASWGVAGCRSSSTAVRRTDGMVSVDIAALRSIEREKEIPFDHADGRARDRAAHRVQAHRALDAARARLDRPQDRRGHRLGAGARAGRRDRSRSTTTRRPTSAGSPR